MEFKRERYLQQLIDGMWNNKIKVITGIRRCGKSYLLFNLFHDYLLSHGVDEKNIISINLENYRNKDLRNPDSLYEFVSSRINGEKHYLLIDEIRFVNNFSDVLNGFRFLDNLDTYVTGSNSKMLSTDIVTEFRGRDYQIRVHPLSFDELYEYRKTEDPNDLLEEYMIYGGLPEVVLETDIRKKSEILKNHINRVYLKDIVDRENLWSENVLHDVFDVLTSTIGSPISPKKISDTISAKGPSVNSSTVSKYISTMENAFIFERCSRYDIKGRRYIDSPYKFYCEDLGLRNARINFRQTEYTHLMENLIYNELRIRRYDVDVGIVKDRTMNNGECSLKQLEVDFVVNGWNKKYYIQSVYSMHDESKKREETRPFKHIKDAFKRIVIVHDNIIPRADDDGIMYIGIIDFLTDPNSIDI